MTTERVGPDQRDRQLSASERRRREYLAGHPPADPRGRFAHPGVWLSAELRSNGWPPSEVARRARALHAHWAVIDIAENETGDHNLHAYADLHQALAEKGIDLGCWGHIPSAATVAARLPAGVFYTVNREAANQTNPGFLSELRTLRPGIDLSVVAGPFDAFPNAAAGETDPDPERPLWEELVMHVEAYTGENPNATPEAQHFQAWQRGFRKIACVVESNETHGWTLEAIDAGEVRRVFGRGVSLYMLGTTSADDLLRFEALAA